LDKRWIWKTTTQTVPPNSLYLEYRKPISARGTGLGMKRMMTLAGNDDNDEKSKVFQKNDVIKYINLDI